MLIDSRAWIDPEAASLTQLEVEMKRAGVQRAVLTSDSRQYLLESAQSSDFLAAVLPFDPLNVSELHVLQHLSAEGKLSGIRPHPAAPHRWINAREADPFWDAAAQLNLPVDLLFRSDEYNQLSDVVTGFPRARLVIDHLGRGPETDGAQFLPILLEYARYPQVHVRISGLFRISELSFPYSDLWPVIRKIYRRFGAHRLTWGSDYPEVMSHGGYSAAARLIDSLPFLSSKDKEWINSTTALKLWFS
ncbi:MAG: amidohydrolase family protein [Acidobacteriota bacterium]